MPGAAIRPDAELMSTESHCFDVTHQVRGRAAKRARHRRGHIFSPRRMEASGEVGQLVEALREAQPGRAAVREQEVARYGSWKLAPAVTSG